MKSNRHAGRFNLKGKKTKKLSCRCCIVRNLKDHYLKKLAMKDMMNDYGKDS